MLPSLSPEQRKALIRHYIETTWNHQKIDESNHDSQYGQDDSQQNISISCADTISTYLGDELLSMPLAELQEAVRKIFPDMHLTVVDILIEGEKVVVRWMIQGTDLGGYDNHLPTGKSVCLTGISILRLEENIIMEEWVEVDVAGMLRQLGFVYVPQPPKISMRRPGPPLHS
jgi:predicted ester cyclase